MPLNLTDIGTVRGLMEKYGLSFQKRFGQNFLISPAVPVRIAESCPFSDTILEIGPGIGTLTREVAKRANKVKAFEIDRGLIPLLGETLADLPQVEVICGDVMQTDLSPYVDGVCGVCANLPYYITTPVLMKLLESRLPFAFIVVMVQKEVAMRLCAPAGSDEAGAVTLTTRYFADAERLFSVPAGCFLPRPKVESTVIRLTPHKPPFEADEELFFSLIKAAYAQRRKTLSNALSSLGYPKDLLEEAFRKAGIDGKTRGEKLSIFEFHAIETALRSLWGAG